MDNLTFQQSHDDLMASFHTVREEIAKSVMEQDSRAYELNMTLADNVGDALRDLCKSWAIAAAARAGELRHEEKSCPDTPS